MSEVKAAATEHDENQAPEFEEDPPRMDMEEPAAAFADDLLLNIDGYEGPIDVLLAMARDQKVDLVKISILQLVRQYLAFIDRAAQMRLELAAEYLVMAAWLAYLKSRLLLPREVNPNEPSAQEMADALQFQLRRLEAMKQIATRLFELPRLGIDIFPRGMPEPVKINMKATYDATLYELLDAYGAIDIRKKGSHYELPTFHLMSMELAMERMGKMLGKLPRKGPWSVWTTLASFVPDGVKDKLYLRSSVASLFTVGLEMAKQGTVELRQDGLFRPIYLRASDGTATPHVVSAEYSNEQVAEEADANFVPEEDDEQEEQMPEELKEEDQSNDGT